MTLNPTYFSRMTRMAMVAAFLLLLSVLWGCSSDSSNLSNADDSDVGVGVCEPGSGKAADDGCNFCTCSDDGQWECTLKGCEVDAGNDDVEEGDADSSDVGEVCEEGDTKSVACNGCVCDDAGNWNCTERDCSIVEPCDGLSCGAPCSTCEPGGGMGCPPVMQYCNADGQCMPATPECADGGGECVEGATKKVECNTCVCDTSGHWNCTKRGCVADGPCAGLVCGDRCTSCVASEEVDCPAVIEYCGADGQCRTETPTCGG